MSVPRVSRRTSWLATMAAVGVLGLGGGAHAAATPDRGTAGRPVAATVLLNGVFTFHACPLGSPAGDFCLTDVVTGTLPGAGPATGTFEVHIAFSQFDAGACGPIDKHGSLRTGRGSVALRATGFYCRATAIADYNYRVVDGAAAVARGTGLWLVPAPATLTGTGGTGPEYLHGTFGTAD
jgi:hypothetical protein